MTTTPSFSFTPFGSTIEHTFIQSWHHKAQRHEMEQLSAIFCSITLRAGLRAALNRLLPETTENAAARTKTGYVSTLKVGGLQISRHRSYGTGAHTADFVVTGNHGSPNTDQFDIFLDTKVGLIAPGPWLQTLQDAANKLPEHRHESPAAFQRWLKNSSAPAAS